MTSLAAVRLNAQSCQSCDLWKTRRHVVFGGANGHRDIRADLMIVGEAPGEEEDASGRPFEGAAGRKLAHLLEEVGLDRTTTYLTNVVKCRPIHVLEGGAPVSRTPYPRQVAACWDYLDAQIALIRPRVIVALGGTAVRRLLGPHAHVGTSRGPGQSLDGCPVVATYHPSPVSLNRRKERKSMLRDDLCLARQLLDGPAEVQDWSLGLRRHSMLS